MLVILFAWLRYRFSAKSTVVTVLTQEEGIHTTKVIQVCTTFRNVHNWHGQSWKVLAFFFLYSLYGDFSECHLVCPLLSVKACSCKVQGPVCCAGWVCVISWQERPRTCVSSELCCWRAEVQPAVVLSTISTLRSVCSCLAHFDHTLQLHLCEISFQEKQPLRSLSLPERLLLSCQQLSTLIERAWRQADSSSPERAALCMGGHAPHWMLLSRVAHSFLKAQS